MAYRGVVAPLPVGQLGFTGTQNPSQAQPGHFIYVDGAELDGGIIRKEGGASKLNTQSFVAGNDSNTKSLLHLNGADTSTTITDSNAGGAAKVWTAAGNAQLDTAQFAFPPSSLLCDGVGDYVSTPDHADFTLGSTNWTIELRFNCNDPADTFARLAGQMDDAETEAGSAWRLLRGNNNKIWFGVSIGSSAINVESTSLFTPAINPGFHHLALVRDSGTLRMFIDGVQEDSEAISGTINDSAADVKIGSYAAFHGESWTGWIDEFRLSNVARWTANFTPPLYEYDAPAGAIVVSGITWQPTPGTDHTVIFLANGSVLRDTGAGTFLTSMKTGLINVRDPPPYFMAGGGEAVGAGRRLFMYSGSNQVQVSADPWTTFAAIAAPAADWASTFPTFGVLHANRMFAGGNAGDPHRLYFSPTADHDDFVGAGFGTLSIYPGEGERLVGGISFRGALIVFKYPAGIYIVNTADPTVANWTVVPLSRAVGTLNQHTIVQIENDTLYMDRHGNIHSLAATNEFGDVNSSNIGDLNDIPPFMRANMNLLSLRRVQGIWYQAKRQAWFAMPMTGASDNNFRLITGFQDPTAEGNLAPRFFMSRRDICPSLWLRPDTNGVPKPVFGDASGFVWLADQDARNKDGVGYPITFEMAATDLGFLDQSLATRSKAGQFLELSYEPRGDWNLTVEVHWDDVLTSVKQFDMGAGGAILGSFILDTDTLAASVVRNVRRRIEGSGRRVKLIAENAGLNQDVSISGFHLSFGLMDERTDE